MRSLIATFALLGIALVGCAQKPAQVSPSQFAPDHHNPQVAVKDHTVSVDQDELTFEKNDRNGNIDWQLITGGWVFDPQKGIVFERSKNANTPDPDAEFNCFILDGNTYHCTNLHRTHDVHYRYTINLTQSDGSNPIHLDPNVYNR